MPPAPPPLIARGLPARVKVFMPQDAPPANKKESVMAGSELNLVDGLISDAGRIAVAVAEEQDLFDLSTLKEPYRAEGKKTMGLEIAMQLGWKMPDAIIYPTGGGTGIIGMYKGFQELLELGWIEGTPPKFIAVQPTGCQPIVKAFQRRDCHRRALGQRGHGSRRPAGARPLCRLPDTEGDSGNGRDGPGH